MKWKKAITAVLIAGALTAAAGAGMTPTGAHAAAGEPYQADYVYTDPRTGEAFFNVYRGGERFVVFRTADGDWMRLPDAILSLWSDFDGGCASFWAYPPLPEQYHNVCYDAAADEVVYTAWFTPSPSGKWGLKFIASYEMFDPADEPSSYPGSIIHYTSRTIQKKETVLLRNNATGEIRQLAVSTSAMPYRWLADGTLLLQKFSETDRQNELVRINPATGEAKRFMLGSMRGYNAERNLLLYVMNEPERRLRIYDFRAGKSRLAKEGETELFYPETGVSRVEEAEPPSLPKDLDLDSLPVADTGYRQEHVAVLTLDGADIPLPFAFVGLDGETYVPLRPLVERGWTMEREDEAYVVGTGRGELRLNRDNGISLNDRLYLPIGLIQTLGHDVEWRWLR